MSDGLGAGVVGSVSESDNLIHTDDLTCKRVYISGHADRSGSDAYNNKLSDMRTNAVAEVIKAGGISGRKLGLGAFGENINAVKTPDGVKSPPNRRVEILISN